MKAKENDIKIEQTGGLPIILKVLLELKIREKLDFHFKLHGNWEGASKGFILVIWLSYIISTCDHRLSSLEDWVKERKKSLEILLGEPIRVKDFTDDKLGKLLDEFSIEGVWNSFEKDINSSFIRIYGFSDKVIQLDATIGKSFRQTIKDGLFQYGHSKHFRKDLPQFKTMLANLADGSFPLASLTVSGEQSDDGLYIPMMKRAKESLSGVSEGNKTGLFWVGDVKMGALATRAYVAKSKDYYLCPLSKVQIPEEVLWEKYVEPIMNKAVVLQSIQKQEIMIARGYECSISQEFEDFHWTERHLVLRSEQYAQSQEIGLNKRLNKAQQEIVALNIRKKGKRVYKTEEDLQNAVNTIEQKYKVKGLLKVSYHIEYEQRQVRGYKGRAARIEQKMSYELKVQRNEQAIERKVATLGWRVYATNQPTDKLSLEQAVLLYREEYKVERRFRNLKEEVTRLLPLFLKKENRIRGLIKLLILVLKVIAAIEFKVAKALEEQGEKLGGLYDGNPKITTARPTISKMMNAFKSFAIVFIAQQGQEEKVLVPKLNDVQVKIIELIGLEREIFYMNSS